MKLLFVVLTFCSYVNLFSGTDGNGHCHPCACTPFGAVQAGPQTGNWGWDYCGGYQWRDTTVMGFSHNRIDGTGSSELGDLLMMPFTGEALREDYSSRFDKAGEIAVPGYYCCTLTDFGIKAEISCTPHVALHRYTSDESPIRLMLDLQSAQTGSKDRMYKRVLDCSQDYSDSLHVRGYTHSKAWNDRVIFFDIEFSRPYTVAAVLDKRDRREMIERTVLDFGGSTDTLMVKTSISIKSVAGAGSNIAAELPGWDFEAVREEAGRMWEERLGRVEIKGTETQKRIFYTAMYHLMMHPNDIADCGDAPLYSTLSLWDTFRAAHPLYTILAPDIVDGVIGSFKYYYDRQGFLPMWVAGGTDKAADLIHGTWTGKYQDSPDGLSGNDDCGQMSAWYIFSALGFYPVNPCGGEYVIGAPQLPRMTVHLPGGRDFTVIARGAGRGKHRVASVRLNGRRMEGCTIGHEDLMKGGKLKFRMR